ncbi:hypothetical protein SISNIDRAFT_498787, partial [Sistotremastrum niveocremeum HHB9708]
MVEGPLALVRKQSPSRSSRKIVCGLAAPRPGPGADPFTVSAFAHKRPWYLLVLMLVDGE